MLEILYNMTIMPIQMLVELVFTFFYNAFNDAGVSIIFVSITIQLIIYPMYKKADMLQEEERNKQKEMEHWTKHIKKTFKGDERFMMQQAYYRICGYNPSSVLKGSLSLLLQIPFFVAAYNYLSHLDIIMGKSFLLIGDLGKPDAILRLFGVSVNILPILMTVINILSGVIYTKGFSAKDKLQLYLMAGVFLVLLYGSPSGLVLYWTMNNVCSLVKNIYLKLVKEKISNVVSLEKIKKAFSGINILTLDENYLHLENKALNGGLLLLTLVQGLLIPLTVISSSPTEFYSAHYGPFMLLLSVLSTFIGIYLVWFRLAYYMMNERAKVLFLNVIFIMSFMSIINFYLFGNRKGVLNTSLVYDEKPVFSENSSLFCIMLLVELIVISFVLHKRKFNMVRRFYQVAVLAFLVLSATKLVETKKLIKDYERPEIHNTDNCEKIIPLSRDGKNVVVIMLDRAIGTYFPYIVAEKPEIKNMFDGFTYFPNTLSYGGHTNFAAPALFAGYEYTPQAMNERADVSLKKKHNESLLVMPRLFLDAGYSVTITDPPYANYKWVSDLSLYDDYPDMKVHVTEGAYSGELKDTYSGFYEKKQKRNFIYYSLMKSSPVFLQNAIYDDGEYLAIDISVVSEAFVSWYSVLENMEDITDIKSDGSKNFLLMQNSSTHDTVYFNAPYYDEIGTYSYLDGKKDLGEIPGVAGMKLDRAIWLTHYETNVASLLRIGEWFEYLKANDVYDNTRIIIVSDHGKNLGQFDALKLDTGADIEEFNPLFLYKDFDATGFNVSYEFMTNADTPTLAMDGVIENPINPFTKNPINSDKKNEPQRVTTSKKYSVVTNNGNTFDTSDGVWYEVTDDIFDVTKWKKLGE